MKNLKKLLEIIIKNNKMRKSSKERSPWLSAIGFTTILFLIVASPWILQLILEEFNIYWGWLTWVTLGLGILGFITTVFLIVYQSISRSAAGYATTQNPRQ